MKILDAVNTDKDKGYFKFAATDEKNIILNKFSMELVHYALGAIKTDTIEFQQGKSYSERSERFQFEDFSFDVKVTSIKEVVVNSHC